MTARPEIVAMYDEVITGYDRMLDREMRRRHPDDALILTYIEGSGDAYAARVDYLSHFIECDEDCHSPEVDHGIRATTCPVHY